MAYLKFGRLKYPFKYNQFELALATLKSIGELEDDGFLRQIYFFSTPIHIRKPDKVYPISIYEKMKEKRMHLSTTLVWELCLLGFINHTKIGFKADKWVVHKHTFRLSKNRKYSIDVFQKAVDEAKNRIKEREEDNALAREGIEDDESR